MDSNSSQNHGRKGRLSLKELASLPIQGRVTPSPDGQQAAFISNKTGNIELYLLDLETREIRQLSHGELPKSYEGYPKWSCNGKRLAFSYY